MSEMPRYIMRNAALFIDRESYVGQASEIKFPEIKRKVEEIRNAGMEMPIETPMGFERPEFGFKMSGFDPATLALFGLRIGQMSNLMATAALVDEDGTVHSQVAFMTGFIRDLTPDAFQAGNKVEVDYMVSVRSYRLEIDGNDVIEMDPFDVRIGGVSQTGDVRRALLL
ncbi:phage major tail tube protein [Leptospira interrogans]